MIFKQSAITDRLQLTISTNHRPNFGEKKQTKKLFSWPVDFKEENNSFVGQRDKLLEKKNSSVIFAFSRTDNLK